jgi:glycosyltransferase involved in cell wall biosynthesis
MVNGQMFKITSSRKPKLSIVVAFYNMRREAARTLHTLTCEYQSDIRIDDYEVLVMDSNSTESLDQGWVESLQANFTYHYVESEWPTPCRAMNYGIDLAQADHVTCIIDGARMLSPGVLKNTLRALELFDSACIQTIALHLGFKLQNDSLLDGYNQVVEDELLDTIDWHQNGYQLFDISTLALSSKNGFVGPLFESNCFTAPKAILQLHGGFDERFVTPGGGLVNHDVLKRTLETNEVESVILLGEGTFHQFHGGVATNVAMKDHLGELYFEEFKKIRGEDYEPSQKLPFLMGALNAASNKHLNPKTHSAS